MSSQGETESLKITGLPLGTTHALEELARVHDQTAEEFARMVIEAKILAQKPFRDILASAREGFLESGTTDDQLAALVEKAREDFHREKADEDE
ncbi:MAG TPA: hypothetical protein VN687_06345 [Blastocatellia bacterium]|nr:hypothetical protein [Blastocatellia bacterium]